MKYTSLPLLVALSSLSIHGMTPSQDPATIHIANDTGRDLGIYYTAAKYKKMDDGTIQVLPDSIRREIYLEANSMLLLDTRLMALEVLYIINAEEDQDSFNEGMKSCKCCSNICFKNLMDLEEVEKAKDKNKSIVITVKPGGIWVTSLLGKDCLSLAAKNAVEAVCPYNYTVTPVEKAPSEKYSPSRATDSEKMKLKNRWPVLALLDDHNPNIAARKRKEEQENLDAQRIHLEHMRIANQMRLEQERLLELKRQQQLTQKLLQEKQKNTKKQNLTHRQYKYYQTTGEMTHKQRNAHKVMNYN